MDVPALAAPVDDFAQQDGAAVPELWHEAAELVPGISRGDRRGPIGQAVARQDFHAFLAGKPIRIEAKVRGEGPVQTDESGSFDEGRRGPREEPARQPCVGVVERKVEGHQGVFVRVARAAQAPAAMRIVPVLGTIGNKRRSAKG